MKSEYSVLDRVIFAAVGLVDIYYGIYMILCIFNFDAFLMLLFALAVMAAVTLPVIFRKQIAARLAEYCSGRLFPMLKATFAAILCIYIVSVIVFWCYIGTDGAKTAEKYAALPTDSSETVRGENTLVVVFGCRTHGMTPSDTLKLRLDEAYELLCTLPGAVCIVSGGQGSNETVPEAVAMKQYLIERGISAERIFEESESHSTSENVRFTKALTESLGLEYNRIIGVSTAFHLPRIEFLCNRYWQKIEVCAAPSTGFARHYVSMIREYLSYIKMVLFDTVVISF